MPSPQAKIRGQVRGFSLVELLVVIGIVAILASLLMGGYGRVKDRAAAAGCANNLRQIGMGMTQFASENRNFYPATYGNVNGTWAQALVADGYVQDTRIFKCPADKITKAPIGKARSYTYCSPVMANNNYVNPTIPLNRLTIESPTTQYMITEWHSSDPYATWDGGNTINAGWDIVGAPNGHSAAGRSFLFADGHVEQRSQAKASDPFSGWVLNQVTNP